MRPDFKKVIIERPRVNGHKKFIHNKKVNEDDVAGKVGIKSWIHNSYGGEKNQTDLLGPLKRYLLSKVGQQWNKVWSEICEQNKGLIGSHLRDHVLQFVEVNCQFVDGVLCDHRSYPFNSYSWRKFYVCPKSGMLRKLVKEKKDKTKPKEKIVHIDGQDYFCYQGIWYRCEFENLAEQEGKKYLNGQDCFLRPRKTVYDYSSWLWSNLTSEFVRFYGKPVRCVSKEQANSKEVKKILKSVGAV